MPINAKKTNPRTPKIAKEIEIKYHFFAFL